MNDNFIIRTCTCGTHFETAESLDQYQCAKCLLIEQKITIQSDFDDDETFDLPTI